VGESFYHAGTEETEEQLQEGKKHGLQQAGIALSWQALHLMLLNRISQLKIVIADFSY